MTEKRVECPRCKQDWLERVRLVALELDVVLCFECDALWLNEAHVFLPIAGGYDERWYDYGTFMRSKGRPNHETSSEFRILGKLLRASDSSH